MSALDVLKELTSQLSLASTGDEIGRALFGVSKRFGFSTALIVDMTHYFNRIGPAIVFSALPRAPLELFDTQRPFANHPFTLRAQGSDKPFVMSRVKSELGAEDEIWWAGLPPHMKETDGIVVPVHVDGDLAWYSGFAGRSPDLSQRTLSVMSAAVHAGYARFKELLNDKSPRSPLTARESECLRWVADGKTDLEVGKILTISPRTVRFHINNAKMKLGVATRIQAVAKRASGAA
jgi:LuxR family transcriptional regulator, quorum-sensing system regulator LasR